MAKFNSSNIRNICLVGHGGDGKTSLAEAMLYLGKATDRLGKTTDGNTICDFDPEEKKRCISVSTSLANVEWNGTKINILDTPGYFDFVGEVKEALSVAETAILVVDAKSGVKVGTELAWDYAYGVPKAFFVNKTDDENSNFHNTLEGLRDKFGSSVCPVFVPFNEGTPDIGYYNLLTDIAYKFDKNGNPTETELPAAFKDKMTNYKKTLDESLAETSEELMEKFFAEEPLTHEEQKAALRTGLLAGSISPVFSGSATNLSGITTLLDIIAASFSSPLDRKEQTVVDSEGKISKISASEDGQVSIFIFKTLADQFGKKSYFKVMNGCLKKDTVLTNLTSGQQEKLARLATSVGAKEVAVDEFAYGDIGVTVKLINTNINDTLSVNASSKVRYAPIQFPTPYYGMAIVPKAKGDEDKISSGIAKLLEEDYTIKYINNAETKQMCVYGIGDTQLDVVSSKLKNRFGTSVELAPAKVPYRETIKKKVQVEGKHKKQSGGHGQYGHVKIEFSHGESEGLEFTESVVGGAVPKNFFPAVEKGLQESMQKGILAGYPVINLKANLFDGSYHDVDSSEMSFKIAANLAFKEGMKQGGAVLLEPIGELKVMIPDSLMGDIIGDLNKRRGRIMGTEQSDRKGYTVVLAEAPFAEMLSYAIQLRAMTQGRGTYTYEFARYEEAPAEVAQKVIAEAKKEQTEE
jgi:elongation factor G